MAERRGRSWKTGAAVAGVLALPAYYLLVRRWHARWGATDDEVQSAMPGDELVERPRDVTTRAVSIYARPEEVWPWLAQMGYQKGGMYSYDWIDRAMGILDKPSSDVIPMGSGPGWPVAAVEPNRSLVLDIRLEGMHISWSFLLREQDEGFTRLILRIRIRVAPLMQIASFLPVFDFGSFLMKRRMLLGIKERAEAQAGARS